MGKVYILGQISLALALALAHTYLILIFLRFTYSNFLLSKKKMAAWVSVPLKCRGQGLQARHVVQCARECSFASLLPKIDSKYEVPMFISTRTKALRTLIILMTILMRFIFFFFPCLPCLIFWQGSEKHKIKLVWPNYDSGGRSTKIHKILGQRVGKEVQKFGPNRDTMMAG